MSFVIDASIAGVWLMPDETHAAAETALERLETEAAFVPAIWWFEIRNLLLNNERRGRIAPDLTARALAALARLPIELDHAPDEAAILRLARTRRLTVYDAAYLALALRLQCPLATLDKQLGAAARDEGVTLLASFA